MSSISDVQSSQLSYLTKLFTQKSQDKNANGTSSTGSSTGTGLEAVMNDIANNVLKYTTQEGQKTSLDSGFSDGGFAQFAAMDSQTMGGMVQSQSVDGSGMDLESLVSSMDADSSGTVTEDEFVSARPDDVTEEMAQNLWDSLDTSGTGELSTSDLQTAMEANAPMGDGGPPPPPLSETASSDSEDSAVDAMDTNGDGVVSQEEFLAARPDDVTEEMAQNLWDSLDTDGDGSMTTDALETAMSENAPSSQTQLANAFNQIFMGAINAYDLSSGYGSMTQLPPAMMAMA